ncbi:Putative RNA recognition motif domain, metallo-beta-lactamase, RNA-binding domain superfamily [Septoria linicola]|uniref:RNA recognition motif domain, metallo-beta-lactamase, RNA-binding domain superfamily n=1 Tax=Septoria linicola TaxID=215465 RepID=A0A9Q9AWI9_9PEZI|nr:putative RNA recognition motif domain, metallo-beta-lactamase, RNA-binding domain superfamily [Septoria linicola]USW53247.1 Putative RNA recognition motif domain, metallo-beta-lactamase, RNA-binding domain superfamily [Septoria linicola]
MSTFDGVVAEFPDIRIDYFRQTQSQHQRPPLAYFLSHVHSDHLQGLESLKQIFIWCSPATREILLRLEKYPHRMNFAQGILESRQQTYRHLKKLLRPIPLETPTEIELVPGRSIRVTLLDANHCVGAVMFLIEGDGKAILYTGDIRAEVWWVNALIRNPVMVSYARHGKSKAQKQLDTIYLDTTFAHKSDRYRHFPTKAEGISELLEKVAQYPRETEFYIDAWTFGYEDVWQALSVFLRSQIHVDNYRYGLYNALANGPEPRAPEAYKLIRAQIGNEEREGCLSTRYRRLHSCERGTGCGIFNEDFVRITPIISRHNGMEMAELGAGGGHGDLKQRHELDLGDPDTFQKLMSLCADKLRAQPALLSSVVQMLAKAAEPDGAGILLELADLAIEANSHAATQSTVDGGDDIDELPLERLVSLLAKRATKLKSGIASVRADAAPRPRSGLPSQITFPYSRHASYSELCVLIDVLLPKDIYPCTVDKSSWGPEHTMSYLFGHLYSTPPSFHHDRVMLHLYNAEDGDEHEDEDEDKGAGCDPAQTQYQNVETQLSTNVRDSRMDLSEDRAQSASSSPIVWIGDKRQVDHNDLISPKRVKRSADQDLRSSTEPHDCSEYHATVRVGDAEQLFVRFFPRNADERDLLEFFASFDVESIHIPGFDRASQHSTRYAFVHVRSAAEAKRAIRELDGKTLLNSKVQIMLANESKYGNSGVSVVREPARSRRASVNAPDERLMSSSLRPLALSETSHEQRLFWPKRIAEPTEASGLRAEAEARAVLSTEPEDADVSSRRGSSAAYGGRSRRGSDEPYRHAQQRYIDLDSPWDPKENVARRRSSEVSVPAMIADRLQASRRRNMVPSRPGSRHGRQRRHSTEREEDHGRLSPPLLNSDELKEALQREAYDAVLNDAKSWALVSVSGHGVKEEEL